VQIALRRRVARYKRKKNAHIWPIDPDSAMPPAGWGGWPEGKQFALVLNHDVDTRRGYDNALKLARLEKQIGFRSQFNFVPERYGRIEHELLDELKKEGFGIGVHGLHHDGKLFNTKKIFDERALRINAYLDEWGTRGFTAPSMNRNHEWMRDLHVDFCISSFDTDPFGPESDGAGTIFPYRIQETSGRQGFLEMPYTLIQDFFLFILLGEKNIDIWEKKLEWIAKNGGMALLTSHPDYMNFGDRACMQEEYPIGLYIEFLEHIKKSYNGQYWNALPEALADFYLNNHEKH
jgi:hypothetical protein